MAETSTTTFMNLVLPTPGERLGPTWATDINTALTRIDEHDHSAIGKKLGVAALTIDGDLDFSPGTSDYATLNKKYSGFTNNSGTLASASFPASIFVAEGNLFYNNSTGGQIQLTDGAALSSTGVSAIQFAKFADTLSGGTSGSPNAITESDNASYYVCDASTAAVHVRLPAASTSAAGRFFVIKDISGVASTNNITVHITGTDTVDGASSHVIASNFGSATFISRGNSVAYDVI